MTPTELAEFKRLLALYLAFTCAHCQSKQAEDRHIITCTGCGVVLSDLRTIIDAPGRPTPTRTHRHASFHSEEQYTDDRKDQNKEESLRAS